MSSVIEPRRVEIGAEKRWIEESNCFLKKNKKFFLLFNFFSVFLVFTLIVSANYFSQVAFEKENKFLFLFLHFFSCFVFLGAGIISWIFKEVFSKAAFDVYLTGKSSFKIFSTAFDEIFSTDEKVFTSRLKKRVVLLLISLTPFLVPLDKLEIKEGFPSGTSSLTTMAMFMSSEGYGFLFISLFMLISIQASLFVSQQMEFSTTDNLIFKYKFNIEKAKEWSCLAYRKNIDYFDKSRWVQMQLISFFVFASLFFLTPLVFEAKNVTEILMFVFFVLFILFFIYWNTKYLCWKVVFFADIYEGKSKMKVEEKVVLLNFSPA